MSFSSDVKKELNKVENFKKENLEAELIGYIISGNTTETLNGYMFITENEFNVEHLYKILFNLGINYEPEVKGKYFTTTIPQNEILDEIMKNARNTKDEYKKYIIKGAFLGAGYINDPNKNYHVEILFLKRAYRDFAKKICGDYGITVKELDFDGKYQVYIKDSEEISKLMALIGANNIVLKYEEIRVYKEMKNDVNRKVNLETANLNKTIDAALRQIKAIKKLKKKGKFDKLPKDLQAVANVRIENPELSLKDLGELLDPPLKKSTINSKLKKILEAAEGLTAKV